MALTKARRLNRRSIRSPRERQLRADGTSKPRVLYFIVSYPTFSETYMHEEIRYRAPCLVYGRIEDIDVAFRSRTQRAFLRKVDRVIEEFQPDVLHGHYFGLALLLSQLSARHGVPFTIRTHSMDVLSEPPEKIQAMCRAANSEWCRGVLAFPSNRPRLAEGGLAEDKLVDCWPVVNFARFYRPEPRALTKRVMCAGPAIEKKAHDEFVDLGVMLRGSGLSFDLFAEGPSLEKTREYNDANGNPIGVTYADPDDMPSIYLQYDWLVYPADRNINKVGFPVAIAEALASGIGVCWQELPGRRDEQLEFLDGAGHLFRSMEQVPAIITQPYPEEKRQAGFRVARRCDIERTKHLLSDAWPEPAPGG
jgi:hypothetical protein